MDYTLSIDDGGDYLIAIVSGVVDTYEELSAMAHGVVEVTSEHWSKKAFVDFRTVSMNIDFLSAQMLANTLEDEGVQLSGIRLACLYPPEEIDIYRLFETTHQNRSLNFRIFESEGKAVEWLKS